MPFITLHLGEKVTVYTDTNGQNVVDLSNANILLTNDCNTLNANNVINKGYVDSEITRVNNLISGGADLTELKNVVAMFNNYQVDSSSNLVALVTELGGDIKHDLSSEVSRATSVETSLDTDLSTEVSIARSAEGVLTSDLSTEVSIARSAEGVLTSDLSTEVSIARSAEGVLTSNLSTEVSIARSAEGVLTSDLSTELSRATLAEEDLLARVDRLYLYFFKQKSGSAPDYGIFIR